MKIKDQIKTRREQLGITILELARRCGVSHQSIRHWESGRSYPSKRISGKLEDALSLRLDWTEGVKWRTERPDITSVLDKEDVDVMMTIRKLPSQMKLQLARIAELYLAALDMSTTPSSEKSFRIKEAEAPIEPFSTREAKPSIKKSPGRKTQMRAA